MPLFWWLALAVGAGRSRAWLTPLSPSAARVPGALRTHRTVRLGLGREPVPAEGAPLYDGASAASGAASVQRALASLASGLVNSSVGALVASAAKDLDLEVLNSTVGVGDAVEAWISSGGAARAVEASMDAVVAGSQGLNLSRAAEALKSAGVPLAEDGFALEAARAELVRAISRTSGAADLLGGALKGAEGAIAAANSTEALETALRSVAEKVERPLRDGLDAVAVAATSAADFQDAVADRLNAQGGAAYTARDGRPKRSPPEKRRSGRGVKKSSSALLLKAWRRSADMALEAFAPLADTLSRAGTPLDESLESVSDLLDEVQGGAPWASDLRRGLTETVAAAPPETVAIAAPEEEKEEAGDKSYATAKVVALALRAVTPLSVAILVGAIAAPAAGLSVPLFEAWPLVAVAAAETGFASGRFLNLLASKDTWEETAPFEAADPSKKGLFPPATAAPPPKLGSGQEKGDSTSLQRGSSRSNFREKGIHALSSPREMIARRKMSQNEWNTTEIRGFKKLANVPPFSRPGSAIGSCGAAASTRAEATSSASSRAGSTTRRSSP